MPPTRTLSNLDDGKYLITPSGIFAPPPIPVGANHGGGPVVPIVVGGEDNVWTVCKIGHDLYTLTLEQTGTNWLSKDVGGDIVVETTPLPEQWLIGKFGESTYSIEFQTAGIWQAWSVNSTYAGTRVVLETFEFPMPGLVWDFQPVQTQD